MKHFFIPPIFILVCLLCLVSPTHAANDQVPTVEFTAPLHFLTPGGEDVEVGPGIFEVEAAESWLKLVPEGEGPASAVLLEATPGTHDEMVTEPAVRLEGAAENPDVVHLGLLLVDGTGLEAIGTKSGIRPRGLNFTFVRKSRRARTFAARPNISLPGPVGQTEAPRPQLTCGPARTREVGNNLGLVNKDTSIAEPTLAVFRNQVHLLVNYKLRKNWRDYLFPEFHGVVGGSHYVFNGTQWSRLGGHQDRLRWR